MTHANPNCDGGHCASERGEVRVLPIGGASNAHLCRFCFEREIGYRKERNAALGDFAKFDVPSWESLEVAYPANY